MYNRKQNNLVLLLAYALFYLWSKSCVMDGRCIVILMVYVLSYWWCVFCVLCAYTSPTCCVLGVFCVLFKVYETAEQYSQPQTGHYSRENYTESVNSCTLYSL